MRENMTATLPATQLGWLSTPGHAYLMVFGDLTTARRCATGYDYATTDCIYLEEDISAGVYLDHRGMTPEQWERVPVTYGELPRNVRRVPAGDLGALHLDNLSL